MLDDRWQAMGRPSNAVAPPCLEAQIRADIKWRREEQERKREIENRKRIADKNNPHKIIRKQPTKFKKKPREVRIPKGRNWFPNPGGFLGFELVTKRFQSHAI